MGFRSANAREVDWGTAHIRFCSNHNIFRYIRSYWKQGNHLRLPNTLRHHTERNAPNLSRSFVNKREVN